MVRLPACTGLPHRGGISDKTWGAARRSHAAVPQKRPSCRRLPPHMAVAQFGRATVSKTVGWGFKPLPPCYELVAQRQLHLAVNQAVNNLRGFESLPAHVRTTTGSGAVGSAPALGAGGRRSEPGLPDRSSFSGCGSVGRALGPGPRGRRFKSGQPDHLFHAPLAQLVEQLTLNQEVLGPDPRRRTGR